MKGIERIKRRDKLVRRRRRERKKKKKKNGTLKQNN